MIYSDYMVNFHGSSNRLPHASGVFRISLQTKDLSLYNLSCWWDAQVLEVLYGLYIIKFTVVYMTIMQ